MQEGLGPTYGESYRPHAVDIAQCQAGQYDGRSRLPRPVAPPCSRTAALGGLGSTSELADDDGTVVGTYDYDVFGPVRTHTGTTTEWTYTGEQNDATGLAYLGAGYYDPATGRFVSQDPFGGLVAAPQSLNRYPYVLNNPLLYRDPYGYFGLGDIVDKAKDVAGAAGGGIVEGGRAVGEFLSDPANVASAAQLVSGRGGRLERRPSPSPLGWLTRSAANS